MRLDQLSDLSVFQLAGGHVAAQNVVADFDPFDGHQTAFGMDGGSRREAQSATGGDCLHSFVLEYLGDQRPSRAVALESW